MEEEEVDDEEPNKATQDSEQEVCKNMLVLSTPTTVVLRTGWSWSSVE